MSAHRRWICGLALAAVVAASACTGPASPRRDATSPPTSEAEQLLAADGTVTARTAATDPSGAPALPAAANPRRSAARARTAPADTPKGGVPQASADVPGAVAGEPGTHTSTARGVTDSTIHVGVRYLRPDDLRAYNAATAREAGEAPDVKAQAQAVIDDINRGGGIAGRKVVAHWREETAQALADPTKTDTDACVQFTEQDVVFAVVAVLPAPNIVFAHCLAERGVLYLASPNAAVDAKLLRAWSDSVFLPGTPESTRMARFWYAELARARWFTKGAAVGVFYFDDGFSINRRTVEGELVPLLKANGIDVRATATMTAQEPHQAALAQQRLYEAGVDHVMILDVSSILGTLFMNAADKRLYYPKYALTSFSIGGYLQLTVPESQYRNITLVSWLTAFDVGPDQLAPPSPQEEACARVVRSGGGGALSSAMSKGTAYATCDLLWTIRRAADRADVLDNRGFRGAVEGIGTWPSVGTYAATFGPDRHDGPSATRLVRYDATCRCLNYAGPIERVG